MHHHQWCLRDSPGTILVRRGHEGQKRHQQPWIIESQEFPLFAYFSSFALFFSPSVAQQWCPGALSSVPEAQLVTTQSLQDRKTFTVHESWSSYFWGQSQSIAWFLDPWKTMMITFSDPIVHPRVLPAISVIQTTPEDKIIVDLHRIPTLLHTQWVKNFVICTIFTCSEKQFNGVNGPISACSPKYPPFPLYRSKKTE